MEFLPPQADSAEVCAWLMSRGSDMQRYFPSVVSRNITGPRMYGEEYNELLDAIGVINEQHRARIVEVREFDPTALLPPTTGG